MGWREISSLRSSKSLEFSTSGSCGVAVTEFIEKAEGFLDIKIPKGYGIVQKNGTVRSVMILMNDRGLKVQTAYTCFYIFSIGSDRVPISYVLNDHFMNNYH